MDFALHDYGNIVVIEPITDGACNWMEVNVYVPRYMQMGKGFAADHHMAQNIIDAIVDNGFEIN